MRDMIEPDIQTRKIPASTDLHLWLSVLDRAVRDLHSLVRFLKQDPGVLEDPVFIYDYRSLRKWFNSTSMELGSFRWICCLVEIEPEWALEKLEKQMHIDLVVKPKAQGKPEKFTDIVAIAA